MGKNGIIKGNENEVSEMMKIRGINQSGPDKLGNRRITPHSFMIVYVFSITVYTVHSNAVNENIVGGFPNGSTLHR